MCAAEGRPKLIVPGRPSSVQGQMQRGGGDTLERELLDDPNIDRYASNWLDFQYVNGLTIKGHGKLDGQGELAWPQNQCPKRWSCMLLPMVMQRKFPPFLSLLDIQCQFKPVTV